MPESLLPHPASFRDPSGFVFRRNGLYYRQVNRCYAADYDRLMGSGLYQALTAKGWLIRHEEVNVDVGSHSGVGGNEWYRTLLPQQIGRISYAGEWGPDQLRDAALLTLNILGTAIGHGMILKDASPSNVQFVDGNAVFIDSLSFEQYDETSPWVAYRQFCECFLFPLYLQHYLKTGIGKILGAWPEGIPAAVTAKLLPWKSRLNAGVWLHVMMQSKIRRDIAQGGKRGTGRGPHLSFSKKKLEHLVDHLKNITGGLGLNERSSSAWSDYYDKSILSEAYLAAKEKLFLEFTAAVQYASALDLGANNGHFSRLLARHKATIVAVDSDWQCINELYLGEKKRRGSILPLCIDLSNPTPAAGFRNAERSSFTDRMQADLVAALALVHHLVLGKNIPLEGVARYFADLAWKHLIVEFVPIADEKAQELIRNKSRWHIPYDAESFEHAFGDYFGIVRKEFIPGTERILYLMTKKDARSLGENK